MENVLEELNNNWSLLEDDIYHVIQGNYEEFHYRKVLEELTHYTDGVRRRRLKRYILGQAIQYGFSLGAHEASVVAYKLDGLAKIKFWRLIDDMLLVQMDDHGMELKTKVI